MSIPDLHVEMTAEGAMQKRISDALNALGPIRYDADGYERVLGVIIRATIEFEEDFLVDLP